MIRQRGRELVGNERSDQRSTGSSSAITVDHASHAGMKTLAVGSKLTKVGATPTLVSIAFPCFPPVLDTHVTVSDVAAHTVSALDAYTVSVLSDFRCLVV